MKSVNYTSSECLSCSTCGGEVIICIDATKTASGVPYITGVLASWDSQVSTCGNYIYIYGVTYDEAQLADPNTDLVETDIHGILCKGCLTSYIESIPKTTCLNTPAESGSLVICDSGTQKTLSGGLGQVPVVIDAGTGEVEFQTVAGTNPCASDAVQQGVLLACSGGNPARFPGAVLSQVPFVIDAGTGEVAYRSLYGRIVFTIGDGANLLTTGIKKSLEITQDCEITGWKLLSDDPSTTPGGIVVDIWNDTYANYPPTVLKTIIDTGSGGIKPTITNPNIKGQSVNVNHWTTAISAGDILRFNVDSVNAFTSVTLILEVTIM